MESVLVSPLIFLSISAAAVPPETNLVIPKIGKSRKSILELAQLLSTRWRYQCHLVLVSLDRREATRRAYSRYCETDRYVPLAYVFDEVANEPQLTYYIIRLHNWKDKCDNNKLRIWKGYAAYDTSNSRQVGAKIICCSTEWPGQAISSRYAKGLGEPSPQIRVKRIGVRSKA